MVKTLSATSPISNSDWRDIRCGSIIIDHDGKSWTVVYIDGHAMRGEKIVAPTGSLSGREVAIVHDEKTGGLTVISTGDEGTALMRPTTWRRQSGVHMRAAA